MTLTEIETALGQQLAAMTPAPRIAWQNKDANLALPYLEFRHLPVSRDDNTLDNTGLVKRGLVLITVISGLDTFTTAANALAEDVSGQFTRGLRLAAGSGFILINRHAEPVEGFTDETHWRVPVRVNYQTEE